MIEMILRGYYEFFDETLKNSTITVLLIACIIMSLGGISRPLYAENSLQYHSANILATEREKNIVGEVEINGQIYMIELIKKEGTR